jgi:hypothetical protein
MPLGFDFALLHSAGGLEQFSTLFACAFFFATHSVPK